MCCTRQASLVYGMVTQTWFTKDRLGRLTPRLKLKGSHCLVAVMVAEERPLDRPTLVIKCLAWKWQNDIVHYSLTRTSHMASLNHRGQGSETPSWAQNGRGKLGILKTTLMNAKCTNWLRSYTHLDLGVGSAPLQLKTCRFSQKTDYY